MLNITQFECINNRKLILQLSIPANSFQIYLNKCLGIDLLAKIIGNINNIQISHI